MNLWRDLSKIQTGILPIITLIIFFLSFGEKIFLFLSLSDSCQIPLSVKSSWSSKGLKGLVMDKEMKG